MAVSFLGSQAALGGTVTLSRPRVITAAGSANTKGLYGASGAFASTSYPAAWALVSMMRPSSAADYLVDVSVGAASAEQVVIANLPYSNNIVTSPTAANYLLPLSIPAGSRVAARCQSNTAGATIDVQVNLFAPMFGGERGLGRVETCGANTGTSLGTTIPGHTSVANTKGTWTELIAATSFPYRWVCLGITHTNAVATGTCSFVLDIGVGAGGSEVVVVPNLCVGVQATIDAVPNGGRSFPLSIPAGTRVSARVSCSVTTASERDLEVVLLGVG
jgi:hypothetical protein